MFYYTYMIYINNPESSLYGKVYYGQHRTNNLNDGYIASGKIINKYIKKYPDGYYRKILQLYNSLEELNKAEYNLIHPHLGKDYCLNLRDGGLHGMLTEETKKLISERTKEAMARPEVFEKMSNGHKGKNTWCKGKKMSEEFCQKQREIKLKNPVKYWEGKQMPREAVERMAAKKRGQKPSEETLKKRSNSLKGKNKGKHKVWDNKELNIYHMEY